MTTQSAIIPSPARNTLLRRRGRPPQERSCSTTQFGGHGHEQRAGASSARRVGVNGAATALAAVPIDFGDGAPQSGSVPAGAGKVVVTGAAGFIGSHLVDALLVVGYQVLGVDRRDPQVDPSAAANLERACAHPRFTFRTVDLAVDPLAEVVTDAQVVFHLAAVPRVRGCWGERFQGYVTANVLSTHRVLEASERAGVPRLVYASSSSVYGPADAPSRESGPTAPVSPYGVTKLAGEQLCLAHATRFDTNLSVVALRYFTVYGPRQRPDMVIGRMLCAALFGWEFTLFGDGSQRREFTYVTDVVSATMAASRLDRPWAVVNVGGGSSITLVRLLRAVREVTGHPVPLTAAAAAQPGDVPATAADLSQASALLGYHPHVDLRTGMAAHTSWLRGLSPELVRYLGSADTIGVEVSR